MVSRELRGRDIWAQAEALRSYLSKANNRGAEFWFRSKRFQPKDRTAILTALSDLE